MNFKYFICVIIFSLCFASCNNPNKSIKIEKELEELKLFQINQKENFNESYLTEEIQKDGINQLPLIQAHLSALLAQYYIENNERDKANECIFKIESILHLVKGYEVEKYIIYSDIGRSYFYKGIDGNAEKYLNKGCAYLAMIIDHKDLNIINAMSTVYIATEASLNLNKYEDATSLSKLSQSLMPRLDQIEPDKHKDLIQQLKFATYFTTCKGMIKDEKATASDIKNIIDKAKNIAKNDKQLLLAIDEMMITYYNKNGEYDKAIQAAQKVYNNSLINFNENKTAIRRFNYYQCTLHLIEAYLNNNEYQKATPYIKKLSYFDNYDDLMVYTVAYRRTKIEGEYFLQTRQFDKLKKNQEQLNKLHNTIVANASKKSYNEVFSEIQFLETNHSKEHLQHKINSKNYILSTISILNIVAGLLALVGFILYRKVLSQKKTEKKMASIKNDLLQQKMLLTQMEPHFIFNSLHSLQALIKTNQTEESLKYISNFGELLRNSIEQSREDCIPLKKELESIEAYIKLHLLKGMNNPFDYTISLDDKINIENTKIPPMLIQPFIENAIEHGIKPLTDRIGLLDIQIKKGEDTIIIKIIDNGIGLRKNNSNNNEKSYATEIAKERLAIMGEISKTQTNLLIKNNPKEGVTVILNTPYTESEDCNFEQ